MHQLINKKNKILLYLFFFIILSTVNEKFEGNQKSYYSTTNQINIKGLSKNNNSKILDQLNNLLYKNIFFVREEDILKTISMHNIIEEYTIKKIYPSTINIDIKPTKLVARLSNSDQLVGANGKLVEDKKNDKKLPYIFGKFNSLDFLKLKKNIEQSKFNFKKFKMLYFFPSNRWDILTDDDILIKLPKDNFFESLNLAYKIINNNNFKNKNIIDLRVSNHLIVK
tara:strand:+ start:290 stop:964 length:675 start_codon:yes stop_codon:yes gene_type:complete